MIEEARHHADVQIRVEQVDAVDDAAKGHQIERLSHTSIVSLAFIILANMDRNYPFGWVFCSIKAGSGLILDLAGIWCLFISSTCNFVNSQN